MVNGVSGSIVLSHPLNGIESVLLAVPPHQSSEKSLQDIVGSLRLDEHSPGCRVDENWVGE